MPDQFVVGTNGSCRRSLQLLHTTIWRAFCRRFCLFLLFSTGTSQGSQGLRFVAQYIVAIDYMS